MKQLLPAYLVLTLAACSPTSPEREEGTNAHLAAQASAPIQPVATDAPAGSYTMDKAHSSLIFRVNHLGFSNYTARFKRFDGQLRFDPAAPEASSVTVTVDTTSIETDYPAPAEVDFNAELQGAEWLNAAQFPEMVFRSTHVELQSPDTMRIDGELTLRGVTRPVVLDATFNGGYADHPMDPHARIGFSARGLLRRSEFGMSIGIPAPGTTMGVGDEVEIVIETEFNGPPLAEATAQLSGTSL